VRASTAVATAPRRVASPSGVRALNGCLITIPVPGGYLFAERAGAFTMVGRPPREQRAINKRLT